MNRWLDFTEQILRKVHWTCTCAQSQGPNLRGGAKYAKYAGDGRWAWCKTKYAKQLFVNTLLAGYWLVRWKKKTSCWQIPFWLCAPSWLPIWVDHYVRLLHIFIYTHIYNEYIHWVQAPVTLLIHLLCGNIRKRLKYLQKCVFCENFGSRRSEDLICISLHF